MLQTQASMRRKYPGAHLSGFYSPSLTSGPCISLPGMAVALGYVHGFRCEVMQYVCSDINNEAGCCDRYTPDIVYVS
ncbi:hypothetical protein BDV33DRAFT_173031 [Aspergillus novoparasiticus]|uniref:Uncharacterized protein n=1 Tax=Aspergillus novoparasiticus TaxID=986946 RepID=A0A5N6ES61_9EURO|nr:hypothetical protein BDV33DRAFT_173031 [Aspergillus novoparasiticus]